MPIAYDNGKLAEYSAICVHPADFGFTRGITLYEGIRIYNTKPFRSADHVGRLLQGAQDLGIETELTSALIQENVRLVCDKNRFAHSTVKLYLTSGACANPAGLGFGSFSGFSPRLLVIEEEFRPDHPDAPRGLDLYRRGITVKTVPFSRPIPTVKSTDYSLAFHALRAGEGKGYDDILFVDPKGYVTEGSTSNFFCVIDGVLTTPKRGMLYGVTRAVLLKQALSIGMQAVERDITPNELANATEAFMTGSFTEMMPICRLDGVDYKNTMNGPVFSVLRKALTVMIAKA